jgi:hypothetical protein
MIEKMTIPGLTCGIAVPAGLALPSLERQIIDFLDGRSDGAELIAGALWRCRGRGAAAAPRRLVKRWQVP